MSGTSQTWIAACVVGTDVALRQTGSGKAVANFKVVVDHRYSTPEGERVEALWFPVTVWGDEARRQARYLKKGSHIFIKGIIKPREWTDRDGVSHEGIEVQPTEPITWLNNIRSNQEAAARVEERAEA